MIDSGFMPAQAHICNDDCTEPPATCRRRTNPEPKSKGGRPMGSSNSSSKQPSAIAQAFKKAGLDWKTDFAIAIKANNRNRIKLWLRLLPYMVTTGSKTRGKKIKGRASKAALKALEAMENE